VSLSREAASAKFIEPSSF